MIDVDSCIIIIIAKVRFEKQDEHPSAPHHDEEKRDSVHDDHQAKW